MMAVMVSGAVQGRIIPGTTSRKENKVPYPSALTLIVSINSSASMSENLV